MTETQVYAFLAETFRIVFNRGDIKLTPELKAADVAGWDSFAQIAIIVRTEDYFGVEFSTKELDSLKNVGDFVAVVVNKTGGGA